MKTKDITLAGISLALLSIVAPLSISVGTVPYTLQTLIVLLICAIMPFRVSQFAIIGYIGFIAMGMPVASAYKGGFSILIFDQEGSTGGFIWAFLLLPIVFRMVKFTPFKSSVKTIISLTISVFLVLFIGSIWFYLVFKNAFNYGQVLAITVTPFILAEIIKSTLVFAIWNRLRKSKKVKNYLK